MKTYICVFSYSVDHRALHSFPTRRSSDLALLLDVDHEVVFVDRLGHERVQHRHQRDQRGDSADQPAVVVERSEEHTSELQSRFDLVCRLLLEKKKNRYNTINTTVIPVCLP